MYSILLSDYEKGLNLVQDRLKKIIKSNFKAVIIAWAFPTELDYEKFANEFFNERRQKKYVGSLINLGVNPKNIMVLNCYDKNNLANFKTYIDESDILVLTGGNPEMLYSKVVQETELLYNIKHYKGIIIGFSAGADLQLKRYFITAKNNYYKYFAFYDGFGVLDDPFYLDVHSIRNKLYFDKLQNVANEKNKNVYAIFDDGAIIYNRLTKEIEFYGQVEKFIPKVKDDAK